MQGGDDQAPPGHVRFAPNSAASFEYPNSFNNDSSADITIYENFNEAPAADDTGGLASSFDVHKPLDQEPLAMQANRTADHFNIPNHSPE